MKLLGHRNPIVKQLGPYLITVFGAFKKTMELKRESTGRPTQKTQISNNNNDDD